MNIFNQVILDFFNQKLREAGYTETYRDGNYWRKPGERGVLYDTAEAAHQMLTERKTKKL